MAMNVSAFVLPLLMVIFILLQPAAMRTCAFLASSLSGTKHEGRFILLIKIIINQLKAEKILIYIVLTMSLCD